jgi:hypothetical protein
LLLSLLLPPLPFLASFSLSFIMSLSRSSFPQPSCLSFYFLSLAPLSSFSSLTLLLFSPAFSPFLPFFFFSSLLFILQLALPSLSCSSLCFHSFFLVSCLCY